MTHLSLAEKQVADLSRLAHTLALFHELDKFAPVQMIRVFLIVATSQGLSIGELAKASGLKTSSVSSYITDLSIYKGGKQLGLVTAERDPINRRYCAVELTGRGRAFLERITRDAALVNAGNEEDWEFGDR